MKKTVFLFVFVLMSSVLWAQQKYALVIGNGNYFGISRLSNAANNANDVAAALQGLGFTVDKVLDANLSQMQNAVNSFRQRLAAAPNSYGFFYYAGHAAQSGGENYLIPVDAVNITSDSLLRQRGLSVQTLMTGPGGAGNTLNMFVLDACRDNPFSWNRSGSRGLAPPNTPSGSVVMYAAGANAAATDGTGRNSLFTTQLLSVLRTPGLSVQELCDKTAEEVLRASSGRQRPEVSVRFSASATAYLGTRPAGQPAASTPQPAPTPAPQPAPTPAPQPAPTPAPTPAPPPPAAPASSWQAGRADPDAANWDIAALDTARDADYLTPVEKDVILEMNKVRTNPQKYVELYIRPMLRYFNGRNYSVPGRITIMTQEGAAAVNDCITALSRAAAVGVLRPERGLSLAAKDHVADQSRTGQTGHNGSDRSTPENRLRRYGTFSGSWTYGENIAYGDATGRDVVLSLLVDDGVPSRGHRTNIMNRAFTQVGVGFGTHTQYRNMCTIDYANGYRSN